MELDAIPTTMFQPNTGAQAQASRIGCHLNRSTARHEASHEKDMRRHDHMTPLASLEDARLMEMYLDSKVATLAARPIHMVGSSQASTVNGGGSSDK